MVFPVHPRTRRRAQAFGLASLLNEVMAIEPVGYLDMVLLEKNARLIATDSGGVQKEAFFYRVPCVTLREETEWVELVELGWNQVCPPRDVVSVTQCFAKQWSGVNHNPYGDGNTAAKIDRLLLVDQRSLSSG